jgi:hypothetical protein
MTAAALRASHATADLDHALVRLKPLVQAVWRDEPRSAADHAGRIDGIARLHHLEAEGVAGTEDDAHEGHGGTLEEHL